MSNISREDDLRDLAERTANGGNRPNVMRRKTDQEISDEHYKILVEEELSL